jgi:carbonic anhydrase
MKKLIQGIIEFKNNLTKENRELFAQLALGQKPDALFIACSDSRVVPNLFASTNPGDLFVLRNVGNLIPHISCAAEERSASAALEFSVSVLQVSDIIVCGHSECGAMQALANGGDTPSCPHLKTWLKHGEEAVKKVRNGLSLDPDLAEHNQISQMNVLQQVSHIESYPIVRERLDQGRLKVHGWWFDIAQAAVSYYDPVKHRFVLIS